MKRLILLTALFLQTCDVVFAQTAPSGYTPNYRLRKWASGANPSADSLNQNWTDIDTKLKDMTLFTTVTIDSNYKQLSLRSVTTTATTKNVGLTAMAYTSAQHEVFLIGGSMDVGGNTLMLGGAAAGNNQAATAIQFRTANAVNTQNGTVTGVFDRNVGNPRFTLGSVAGLSNGKFLFGDSLYNTSTLVMDASRNLLNIGTITSGLINGQTISSAANFTGSVTAGALVTASWDGGNQAIGHFKAVNTNAGTSAGAAFQMKTGASANVWQMFTRNNILNWGIESVSDLMSLSSAGALNVTGSVTFGGNVNIGANYLSNDGGNEGVSVATDGVVTVSSDLNVTAQVNKVNNIQTEGNFGVAAIVDTVVRTGKSATISGVTFNSTTTAGLYEVHYFALAGSGSAFADQMAISIDWSNAVQTKTSSTLTLNSTGNYIEGTINIYHDAAGGTGIVWTTTYTNADGGGVGTYDVYFWVKRLN